MENLGLFYAHKKAVNLNDPLSEKSLEEARETLEVFGLNQAENPQIFRISQIFLTSGLS